MGEIENYYRELTQYNQTTNYKKTKRKNKKTSACKKKKNQANSSEPHKLGLISKTYNLKNSRLEFNQEA
jgi:hypothetical protein